MIKPKISDYQKKVFGDDINDKQLQEETTMNGAQLDALKRFFKDLEGQALSDRKKTDYLARDNKLEDTQLIRRKLTQFRHKKADDKVNLKQWSMKQQKDKDRHRE